MGRHGIPGKRNTDQFSRNSTRFKLPDSIHGSDNGALHIVLMRYLVPESTSSGLGPLCQSIWENSEHDFALFSMQACTRLVIGERTDFPERHVRIFAKGNGWARDQWLLKSHWSDDDFMVHSIKDQRLRPDDIAKQPHDYELISITDAIQIPLAFPVLERLNITQCKIGEVRWSLDGRLRISNLLRSRLFHRMRTEKFKEQHRHFEKYLDSLRKDVL
ncbi:hypothetical protein PENTCL1PPCAC_29807 [Pristionchus entomophagus]|uniref:Uncharacterized protein n=1 Tax=Pristionchus entomophagus TaxID=358040 RepID=A0AAV5UMR9_9BILA|nr:hypothetical protein PENTCL1PPCAC_29807 [Pristionchus entomophagus]